MSLINDTRGETMVSVWITALVLIFGIITVYVFTYDLICVRLFGIALNLAPDGVEGGYFSAIGLLRSLYNVFPWIMIFGVLLWAFTHTQRKEYEEGYYD